MFAFWTSDAAAAQAKMRKRSTVCTNSTDAHEERSFGAACESDEEPEGGSLKYVSPRKYFFQELKNKQGYKVDLLKSRHHPLFQQDSLLICEEDYASHGMAMEMGVRRSKLEFLRHAIVDCSLSPNARNPGRSGATLLHIACKRGKVSVFDLLLDLGARWNVVDGQEGTLMHEACRAIFPAFSIMQRLLRFDSRMLFLKDDLGKTPLNYVHVEDWNHWKEWINENLLSDHLQHFWDSSIEGEGKGGRGINAFHPKEHEDALSLYQERKKNREHHQCIISSCPAAPSHMISTALLGRLKEPSPQDLVSSSSRMVSLSLDDKKMLAQGKLSMEYVLGEQWRAAPPPNEEDLLYPRTAATKNKKKSAYSSSSIPPSPIAMRAAADGAAPPLD